eukprot:UN09303
MLQSLPQLKQWLHDLSLSSIHSALIEMEFESLETLVMLNNQDIEELIAEMELYLQENNQQFTAIQKTKFRTALISQKSKYDKLITKTNLSIKSYLCDKEKLIKSSTDHLRFNIQILNLYELFQSEINKQIISKTNVFLNYIFNALFYQNICQCCCIGYKPLDILQIIAHKLSNKLTHSGYAHQLSVDLEKIKKIKTSICISNHIG